MTTFNAELNPLTGLTQSVTAADDFLSDFDVPYDTDPLQRFDVYRAQQANAPWIVMVHGGLWIFGDKSNDNMGINKANYWCRRGVTVITLNYQFVAPHLEYADIVAAIVYIKANATTYGIDPDKMIMMGHSAGGHLATMYALLHPTEIVGSVILDSACMDVPEMMNASHAAVLDTIFGANPVYWASVSPMTYVATSTNMLIVTSNIVGLMTDQNIAFATAASASYYGTSYTHAEVNEFLGLPNTYTQVVSDFIDALI
jgi:arylformamidase